MRPRWQRPAGPTEVRLTGRLTADPEPAEGGVLLRVATGPDRRSVLLVKGRAAAMCRRLRGGAEVYTVGTLAPGDAEHDFEVRHALALEPEGEPVLTI